MARNRLTDEEKQRIRSLAAEGLSATDIAKQMHITRNCAARWKKEFGFPTKRPLPAKQILKLLGNTDQRKIAKLVGFPYRRVQEFAVGHGFGRTPSRELSLNELVSLIGDIRDRLGSAASLARMYRYSYKKTLVLAHVVLKCEKFLPTWKTPLSSYFSSRPPRSLKEQRYLRRLGTPSMEDLARIIIERHGILCDGKLPHDESAEILCAATLESVPCLRAASEAERDHFGRQLRVALLARLAAEGAVPQWLN